jgi:hypothetical protein
MKALTVLLSALLNAAPPPAAEQQEDQEEEPFREPARAFEAGLLFDVRFAHTGETRSFMDGGLGKTRYGSAENEASRSLLRLSQVSFVADARFSSTLGAYAQLNFDAEPDRGDAGERVDLVEAFLRLRFGAGEGNEIRGRAGLYIPPVSLEHPGKAWSTVYTITPSVINAWVGEEVRSLGGELTFARTGLENEISFFGSAFGGNDPDGSLLAYRGWASHDRQIALADRIPLPPLPSFEEGGIFSAQAPWAEPVREVDDRPGYSVGATWNHYRRFLINALYYDTRARRDAFDGEQYGWDSRFYDVGLRLSLGEGASGPELLGQYLAGDSWMGNQEPDLPKVRFDYQAAYSLFTVPFGRQRVSFRYDWFRTEDRDEFRGGDDNDESGYALALDFLLRITDRQRLALELMRVSSERPARAAIGLPPEAVEWLIQISYRIEL